MSTIIVEAVGREMVRKDEVHDATGRGGVSNDPHEEALAVFLVIVAQPCEHLALFS